MVIICFHTGWRAVAFHLCFLSEEIDRIDQVVFIEFQSFFCTLKRWSNFLLLSASSLHTSCNKIHSDWPFKNTWETSASIIYYEKQYCNIIALILCVCQPVKLNPLICSIHHVEPFSAAASATVTFLTSGVITSSLISFLSFTQSSRDAVWSGWRCFIGVGVWPLWSLRRQYLCLEWMCDPAVTVEPRSPLPPQTGMGRVLG